MMTQQYLFSPLWYSIFLWTHYIFSWPHGPRSLRPNPHRFLGALDHPHSPPLPHLLRQGRKLFSINLEYQIFKCAASIFILAVVHWLCTSLLSSSRILYCGIISHFPQWDLNQRGAGNWIAKMHSYVWQRAVWKLLSTLIFIFRQLCSVQQTNLRSSLRFHQIIMSLFTPDKRTRGGTLC